MPHIEFNLPKGDTPIIKVVGVGGGGSNAVNYMFSQGIKGVDFLICNTDKQALDASPIPSKLQLGGSLTDGNGAGSVPEMGRNAAIESADDIKEIFGSQTKMVFITAGMGGGTGTGAAPIIAQTARELGILTVGIVTLPFLFEGRKRKEQAEKGIEELRKSVDTLLIIKNDKLRQMYGNLKMSEVFAQADNVLTIAAKGIAEIITRTGHINVDFQDVSTVMRDSGAAIMGAAAAEGENRASKAIERALASPLLNDSDIEGARYILLNMEYGTEEITMDEISEITDFIQEEAGQSADIIWGYGQNDNLGAELSVTVIATGFEARNTSEESISITDKKKVIHLDDDKVSEPVSPQVKNTVPPPATSVEPTLKPLDNDIEAQGVLHFKLDDDAHEKPSEPKTSSPLNPFGLHSDDVLSSTQHHETPSKPSQPTSQDTEKEPIAKSNDYESKETKQSKEQGLRVADHMSKLREYNKRLRTTNGLSELEKIPAYKRKSIKLDDVPYSAESQVSRYSLDDRSNDDEGKTQINTNNSFLHDNVD